MIRAGALASAGLLAAVFVLLELVVRAELVSPFVVPPPHEVLAAIPGMLTDGELGWATVATFGTTFAATALALLAGVPAGVFLATHRQYGAAYAPWLEAAFSAPIILLYPLFLIFFGRSLVTVVAMGFVVAVIPMTVKTQEGVGGIPPVLRNVALSLGMTRAQTFWKVVLPASVPSIFVGLRLALIYAMINIVAVEFLVGIGGLGYVVADMYDRYDIPSMYSAIVFVIALSSLFFLAVERFERWLKPA